VTNKNISIANGVFVVQECKCGLNIVDVFWMFGGAELSAWGTAGILRGVWMGA
jgi:hypothetical protein